MQYGSRKLLKYLIREKYQIKGASLPPTSSCTELHIGNNQTTTMSLIFEKSYLIHYYIKLHIPNDYRNPIK